MKALVIGAKGYVGKAFHRYFCGQFPDSIGTHYREEEGYHQLDLEDPHLSFSVDGYHYALITGGICNPRACESDPERSYRCNVSGPIQLGKELLQRGVTPIFFSTDYVFDGSEKLYGPSAPAKPLNEYGKQKAELEKQASDLECLVVRLSKVYGVEKGDGTLFDEMASALKKNERVRAARDQAFAPVCIEDVVRGVLFLMHLGQRGTVNMGSGTCSSRFEMAMRTAELLDVEKELVEEISLQDLNDSFSRPNRVHLASTLPAISWEEGLQQIVSQYAEQ